MKTVLLFLGFSIVFSQIAFAEDKQCGYLVFQTDGLVTFDLELKSANTYSAEFDVIHGHIEVSLNKLDQNEPWILSSRFMPKDASWKIKEVISQASQVVDANRFVTVTTNVIQKGKPLFMSVLSCGVP